MVNVNWGEVVLAGALAWGGLRAEIAYRRYAAAKVMGVARKVLQEASLKSMAYYHNTVAKAECALCHEHVTTYAQMSDNSTRCLLCEHKDKS